MELNFLAFPRERMQKDKSGEYIDPEVAAYMAAMFPCMLRGNNGKFLSEITQKNWEALLAKRGAAMRQYRRECKLQEPLDGNWDRFLLEQTLGKPQQLATAAELVNAQCHVMLARAMGAETHILKGPPWHEEDPFTTPPEEIAKWIPVIEAHIATLRARGDIPAEPDPIHPLREVRYEYTARRRQPGLPAIAAERPSPLATWPELKIEVY